MTKEFWRFASLMKFGGLLHNFPVFLTFLSFECCRRLWWQWGSLQAVWYEHGIWTMHRDEQTGSMGACQSSRPEPSQRNWGTFENQKGSSWVLVGRPCLESVCSVTQKPHVCWFYFRMNVQPLAGCSLAAVLYALIKVGKPLLIWIESSFWLMATLAMGLLFWTTSCIKLIIPYQ